MSVYKKLEQAVGRHTGEHWLTSTSVQKADCSMPAPILAPGKGCSDTIAGLDLDLCLDFCSLTAEGTLQSLTTAFATEDAALLTSEAAGNA